MTVVLLANGETPVGSARRAVCRADALVACDGALARARACGREPDFVVGDGDSLPAADRATLGERFIGQAEQDTNDLAKAVRFVRERYGTRNIHLTICGAGGGREDHLIGNVFRLTAFARDFPDVALLTGTGRFDAVAPGTGRRFDSFPGQAVSVFAPLPDTHAASEGLVWPLAGVPLDALWAGTLNRAAGRTFFLQADRPLLVYRCESA